MKHVFRPLASLLALLLLILPLAACGNRNRKTLLTLDRDGTKVSLSVNFYRFQLSRLKGSFVGYGYTNAGGDASDDAFWSLQDKFDGGDKLQTWDEYYRAQVLETCKIYLVGLWVFEKNDLKLSETAKQNIQAELDDLVNDYGNGSKTKLNAVLAAYGVNYRMLKDVYETEAKLETAQDFLYGANASGLGSTVKEEYLNAHYLRFKQIFFAKYDYEYITDGNGDVVYYDADGNILYNTKTGYPKTVNGKTVYYLSADSARIAYDYENGSPKYKTDAKGDVIRRELTADEAANVLAESQAAYEQVRDGAESVFETVLANENGTSEFSDGYYLLRGTDYASVSSDLAYLSEIEQKLDGMEIGAVDWLASDSGYHIIRRYAPTEGAYNMEVNEVWFSSFADGLMAELFLAECETYLPQIAVDESVLAAAPSLAKTEANLEF